MTSVESSKVSIGGIAAGWDWINPQKISTGSNETIPLFKLPNVGASNCNY